MKKSVIITILIVIIGSLGLYKMTNMTKTGYFQHKGLVNSLIRINEEELAENRILVELINNTEWKFDFFSRVPSLKNVVEANEPIFLQIGSISNNYDDYYLDKVNELIEAEKGGYPWFTKNKHSQVINYKNFYSLKNILSYEVTTRVYGADTEKSDSLGKELIEELNQYRNKLIELIVNSTVRYNKEKLILDKSKLSSQEIFDKHIYDIKYPNTYELTNIYSLLTKSDTVIQNNKRVNWRFSRFNKVPLISVVHTFTSLRNDIRKAQEIASEIIVNRVEREI